MAQGLVHRAGFRLALMLFEVGLQLQPGFFVIDEEFLPRAKHQLAHIAIGHAGRRSDEACDLQVPLRHAVIMAADCRVRQICVPAFVILSGVESTPNEGPMHYSIDDADRVGRTISALPLTKFQIGTRGS